MFCSRSYLGPLNTMYLLSGWVSDFFSLCHWVPAAQFCCSLVWFAFCLSYPAWGLLNFLSLWIYNVIRYMNFSGAVSSVLSFGSPIRHTLCPCYYPAGDRGDGQFFQSLSALQFEWLLPLCFQFTGLFYSVWSVNDAHPRNFLSSIFFMICHPGISMPLFLYLSFPTLLSSLSFKPSGIPV